MCRTSSKVLAVNVKTYDSISADLCTDVKRECQDNERKTWLESVKKKAQKELKSRTFGSSCGQEPQDLVCNLGQA